MYLANESFSPKDLYKCGTVFIEKALQVSPYFQHVLCLYGSEVESDDFFFIAHRIKNKLNPKHGSRFSVK